MGTQVSGRAAVSEVDPLFRRRLDQSLAVLRELVERPGFGGGAGTVGAELELFLCDDRGAPLPANIAVVEAAGDRRVVVEGNSHLTEINLSPAPLADTPFRAMRAEMDHCVAVLAAAAAQFGARIVPIGTLPTLRPADLTADSLTALPRYAAIDAALVGRRGEPFAIDIAGEDAVRLDWGSIALVGATCSWQVHLAVAPADYTRYYNAAQLATGPALAAAGNSPLLLGKRLWHESRIPLCEQVLDDRDRRARAQGRPGRVSFGRDWLTDGVVGLFAETVREHGPTLGELSEEDPERQLRAGAVPALNELRLHQSTVWTWNRPVYDPAGGGHVRVEMRALPSGPTAADMTANAAFLVGLLIWLGDELPDMAARLPFAAARGNFRAAARDGIGSTLAWPSGLLPGEKWTAADLVTRLIPLAAQGLRRAGTAPEDSDPLLATVAERVGSGQTGAVWQRRALAAAEERRTHREALADVVRRYADLADLGEPVHRWPVPGRARAIG
ncbi:hypothetical protein [Actinokineospora iranica]|uniref:Gamma-glutamyl:cysteine ligase YbdK, ATP-grasp superfamily n=1 Tax=Actinokineospora iranica TaxID=1271860 RepID=A0A1G6QX09_9PSEU|nr:hypothetical protein [Actinokineospora iranica]SDC96743.1 Gamma-glutamyl:cysteine ligase YbdK, ATP-grasp superfamily [Actinokineospora iranica]